MASKQNVSTSKSQRIRTNSKDCILLMDVYKSRNVIPNKMLAQVKVNEYERKLKTAFNLWTFINQGTSLMASKQNVKHSHGQVKVNEY